MRIPSPTGIYIDEVDVGGEYETGRPFVCLAPDGQLEIWTIDPYYDGRPVAFIERGEREEILKVRVYSPEFWGREFLGYEDGAHV